MVDLTVAAEAAMGVFGEDASFVRSGGVLETVSGIFDARHYTAEADGGAVGVSELETTLVVRTAVTAARGTVVTIRGDTYTVKDIRPDSEGMKVLVLEIAPDA